MAMPPLKSHKDAGVIEQHLPTLYHQPVLSGFSHTGKTLAFNPVSDNCFLWSLGHVGKCGVH